VIPAVGGELKNTVCLTRGNEAFWGQHIGDPENSAAFDCFREAIDHLSRILEPKPGAIAHDLLPDYLSAKWALAQRGSAAHRRAAPPSAHRRVHGGKSSRRARLASRWTAPAMAPMPAFEAAKR
jgi:hypothetical protein